MTESSVAVGRTSGSGVGVSAGRPDARLKCRGEAEFVDDLSLPSMLHAKVLRSPVAHARILGIDTTRASQVRGVVRVITSADLPFGDRRYGHILSDQPVLADNAVRYVGQPVVITVAEDPEAALEALALIEVEYDALPPVDLTNAFAPDVPHVHPEPVEQGFMPSALVHADVVGNVCYEYADQRGDIEVALAEAAHVVERDYTFPSTYQYAMEPHGAIALRQGNTLELWASCQHPFLVRREISRLFGLGLDDVRLHVPFVGGGFGSKSYTTVEPLVCAAAWLVNAPVKLINTVEESMQTSRQQSMRCRMLTAVSAAGELLVRSARILMDTGAYATNGPLVTFMTGLASPGPYAWRALDINAKCIYTTRSPAGSYRGFGSSHTQWISESQLDVVAALAGLDRFELRRRSLLRRGDLVHPRLKPLDADLADSFERVVALLPSSPPAVPGMRTGVGIGFGVIPAGAEPSANALVRIRSDGRVKLMVGTTEIGQGARTVFAQIVAEVLDLPLSAIDVPGADTSVTPFDRSTGASRSTTLVGLAVERASRDLVTQLGGVAGRLMGTAHSDVTYTDRHFASGEARVSLDDLLGSLGENGDELVGRGRVGVGTDSTAFPVYWEVCAGGAVVNVDVETGKVTVAQTVGAPDVGRAINPQLVAVQDSGCTMQAIGHTLLEELEFGEEGEVLTPTLVQYHVPTTEDVPEHMFCELVENVDGPGPFGAKGCGEGAFGAVPAAIVTGLLDAGVRIYDLPATPERVWASLHPEGDDPPADSSQSYRALA